MKINDLAGFSPRILGESAHSKGSPAASGFGEIFRKTLQADASAGAGVSPPGAGIAIRLQPVDPMPLHATGSRVAEFLDLLDDYQRQLADPRVNLKGLDAVVQVMESGRDALSPLLAALPENEGLKDVLNQTLVTAEIEIIRFRRGDYLPA